LISLGKKHEPDEVMIYHLIHSPKHRGQVGQFTIEEFWLPECRIRINNTTNGMCLYGKARTIPKGDVLDNAFTVSSSLPTSWNYTLTTLITPPLLSAINYHMRQAHKGRGRHPCNPSFHESHVIHETRPVRNQANRFNNWKKSQLLWFLMPNNPWVGRHWIRV